MAAITDFGVVEPMDRNPPRASRLLLGTGNVDAPELPSFHPIDHLLNKCITPDMLDIHALSRVDSRADDLRQAGLELGLAPGVEAGAHGPARERAGRARNQITAAFDRKGDVVVVPFAQQLDHPFVGHATPLGANSQHFAKDGRGDEAGGADIERNIARCQFDRERFRETADAHLGDAIGTGTIDGSRYQTSISSGHSLAES